MISTSVRTTSVSKKTGLYQILKFAAYVFRLREGPLSRTMKTKIKRKLMYKFVKINER